MKGNEDFIEKRPLLEDENCKQQHNEHSKKTAFPRWLTLSLGIIVVFLHFVSYLLNLYVMNQYSYKAYYEKTFPNSSHKSSGNTSACEQNTNTTEYKQQIVIQKLTSEWGIYCTLASNIPGIIFTINIGSLSDAYGRKLFFVAPLLGTVLKNGLCCVGIYYGFNIELFIIFYGIEGCTGNWISTMLMVYCYIADLTEPGKPRSLIYGILEGIIGIAAFISSTFSGYLIKWTDGFFYPEVTSVGFVLLGLMIAVFVLPESLPPSKRRDKVSFLENIGRATECYRPNFSPHGKQWMFINLLFIFILSGFANLGRIQVETLYELNSPFCWDSVKIGWYGALKIGMLSIGGMIMIKTFHFCVNDEYIALTGFVTSVISAIVFGLSTTDTMLYIAAVLNFGNTVTMPIVRSIMSRMTPAHKIGSVFAGIAAIEFICNMASSLLANAVYDATVEIYKGFTFFVMAGYAVIGIVLCCVHIVGQKRHEEKTYLISTTEKASSQYS
ncbi:lysosomal proton-coupled steroid conjugate and bile acid symporter SLC46A3-like [Mytilus trossulus]|uniref:lysosomal proton-coupled steroid conjugate and bile acid symporter SLC46A3-like n=1 Tax=Mytilus trossulus TaxID=6551 RepID=UPI003006F990